MATIDLGKVVGEQGPQGEPGVQGPQGDPGPMGYGLPETTGNVGEMVYTGTDGSGEPVPLWGDGLTIKHTIGARSITDATVIVENENLDNLRVPGNYAAPTAVLVGTLVNCPVEVAFTLFVSYACGTNAYIGQEIIETVTGVRHYRSYRVETGVWSTWTASTDISEDDLPVIPISKGGSGAETVEGARANFGLSVQTADITITNTDFACYVESETSNDYPKLYKFGNVVTLYGSLKVVNTVTSSSDRVSMFTVPEGFRPARSIQMLQGGSGLRRWLLTILPTGVGQISRHTVDGTTFTDIEAGNWLPFGGVTYVVND